ncbi:MAG: transglycosylase SLT domain-containing protein [Bacteroidota bacterium]
MIAAFRARPVQGPARRTGVFAVAVALTAGAVTSAPAHARPPGATAFARGVTAFRAGDYPDAARALRDATAPKGNKDGNKNGDWILYLQAESAFYAGAIPAARQDFERLSKMKTSRFADIAAFRAADCAWTSGARADAAGSYRRLLARVQGHPVPSIDLAVARFRVAQEAEARGKPEAARLFLALYRDSPAHPLATEARRHLPAAADNAVAPEKGSAPPATPASVSSSAADQLRRAETLTADRHWSEALDELEKLPPNLPASQAVERDYQIGMTKFHMRRDYGKAAQLLLAVAPSLTGEKAASALFHGTRALSRIDRDDEAIAGYKQVVARFPQSRYAAEAQFLSGWLDYNRGRYRESLPGLHATLDRFGKSAFADDAAWCVAFAHFLLDELPQASSVLDRYARMAPTGMTADERAARVAYWRARIDAKAKRLEPARTGYRDVNKLWPFTFYGVAARARLAELGETAPADLQPGLAPRLPRQQGGGAPAAPLPAVERKIAADATLARVQELAAAGLDVEAGWELRRAEKELLGRFGDANGTRLLLSRYPGVKAFRRAYEIAESRSGGALSVAPEGDARVWWQAAYPRAYQDLVERYGPPAGNPALLLYAIMRKESGFSPWDVSTADARGLLQMIPPTSARVAQSAGLEFFPDELFDPETNIRLGAAYIGALSRKFGGQIPLVAGAYNAGPKAMAKWCDQHGKHPMDEFVELIAFTQTREYAKRVVAIFARYRRLYTSTPYQLPLTVDPKYAAAGPDY